MSSIHNYRITQFTHYCQTTHISYKSIITKARTTFSKHQVLVTCFFNFSNNIFHIPRSKKLRLFNIYSFTSFCRSINQISLTAQKCRNLQNVNNFCCFISVPRFMDISYNRNTQIFFDLSQNFQTFINTRTSKRVNRGTISLIKRCFKHIRNA